jgi:CelD/BcsL family acetyltransferase involved in cellulose biosynthesis
VSHSDPHPPPAPRRPSLRYEWIERLDDLERIEPQWRALEACVGDRMVFGSFDYITTWYRHHAAVEGAPLVGTAWRGSDLAGLLPLAFRHGTISKVPVRRADSACHDGEVGEILVPEEEGTAVLRGLLESLFARGGLDVALLNGFAPGSARLRAVEEVADREGLQLEREEYRYATVDLSQGYAAYERALGSRLRSNLRRRLKRAEEMGGASFDWVHATGDRDAVPAAIARMAAIAERSWKAQHGDPMQERYRRFYAEIAERFAARGMLDLSFLRVGGRDAAFVFALKERGVYHDVTISYAEEFHGISPGTLLIQEVAKRLPAEGIRLVVSHGDHEYKRYWTSAWEPQVRAVLFTGGLRGRLSRIARFKLGRMLRRGRAEAKGVA